jgi:alginate O-acetyltransferase complex protein AlgI
MSFHTLDYLLFLPIVIACFFLTPHRYRWLVLLVASNLFYASWRAEFLSLLWLTTIIDYVVTRLMPLVSRKAARRGLLAVSLTCNLGMLLFFKYFALLANTFLAFTHPGEYEPVNILLPLGISFYTFQTLGYVIDVYRDKRAPEPHLGYFAVYVMYFPQLIAGPIERAGRILPQLRTEQRFDTRRAAAGGALMLIGYFKKLVIADRLALFVPMIMADPKAFSPGIVTTFAFGSIYQYYADLSGYADIAIGSSLIMGIVLAQNFNRPLAAVSISQFWQRWHITVTNWFRDYVYLPVARSARGAWRKPLATMVTIVIISFWHGAAWTWLASGVVAGGLMIAEGWLRRNRAAGRAGDRFFDRLGLGPRQADFIKDSANRVVLWLFLVLLGSLVNAPSWDNAMIMWHRMAQLPGQLLHGQVDLTGAGAFSPTVMFLVFAIAALEIYQWLDVRRPVFERLADRGKVAAFSFYYAVIASIFILGAFSTAQFIYFRF